MLCFVDISTAQGLSPPFRKFCYGMKYSMMLGSAV